MSIKMAVMSSQIKKACRCSGAAWAVYLSRWGEEWRVIVDHGLSKARRALLDGFIGKKANLRWLNETLDNGRIRSRKLKKDLKDWRCDRVYAIPAQGVAGMILAGADQLDAAAKSCFEIMAMNLPQVNLELMEQEMGNIRGDILYSPSTDLAENVLHILDSMIQIIPAERGYIAIRSGDSFRVEAVIGFPLNLIGTHIQITRNSDLAGLVETQRGVIRTGRNGTVLQLGENDEGSQDYWIAVPMMIGTRMIGFAAFAQQMEYSQDDLDQAEKIAHHVSPAVERAIAFVETSRYLQRFALINDISTIVTVGIDLKEFISRIKNLLGRSFKAYTVSIWLLDEDGGEFYQLTDSKGNHERFSVKGTLEGTVLNVGQPVQIDNIAKQTKYASNNPDVLSKLVVPLRFHGRNIGVLSLESEHDHAFSDQDEQLMMIIANQIAGIIEHMRLNEETRKRAQNLQQINEIIQRIVGLTQVSEIAQLAAQMMVEKFNYEMILIMLLDEDRSELVAEGVAGTGTQEFPHGLRYASTLGIPGEVMEYGQSILLKDVQDDPRYIPLPGWEHGSEMCVPLQDAEKTFGVINVEFQKPNAIDSSDLLVLEALGGALSSVLMYARRYEEMDENLRQLEAVRETALDFSGNLNLNLLLKRVVNRVRQLVDAQGAEFGLVDFDKEQVVVLLSENPWQDYSGYIFPFMSGVTGRVAALGEPIVVADYHDWSGKKQEDFKAPFTSVAGVPLKISGEVIGTLVVQDDRPSRAFVAKDLKILEMLAPQLAIFIRNARLYEELEERIKAQGITEERLIRSAKLAAVGEMAAGVAHELNNPLTTVTGFAELVLDSLSKDSPEYEDMTLVLQEAHRARSVVRRLLDFSRQGEVLRTAVDINELLTNVLALVHHLALTSNVEVRVELWDGMPKVRADRNQMQQVFLNLIHNSLQAMPDGGELVLQTFVEERNGEKWIAAKVQDNGQGIKEEDLDQVFEPFFTTKPSGKGTGLGLSVSYGIVSDHGGYIEVESQEGEGAIFTVWLPVEVPVVEAAEQRNA